MNKIMASIGILATCAGAILWALPRGGIGLEDTLRQWFAQVSLSEREPGPWSLVLGGAAALGLVASRVRR